MITDDLLRISYNQGVSSGESLRSRIICDSISECGNTSSNVGNSSEVDDAVSKCFSTPGGSKFYDPICVDKECVPYVNQLFDSLAEAKRRTVSNRCGCEAKVILKIVDGHKYRFSKFVKLHNHELVPIVGRQFLRANREMGYTSRKYVYDASKVNIGVCKCYTLMKEMVGGYANVGATVRDYRNFSRDMKEYVGHRDAQMIIDKFKVKHESCEGFYYAYDMDSEDRLTKIFWADSIARRNYELYGDAVSFDVTFDTNMYNMVFCPFTGVDKYDKCVTFAFVLLSKEDTAHFQWAFDNLVKAMGRNPVVIITDQCPAMKQAIPASFIATDESPATKHRLCMWHIMQKFPLKLGNHLCKETDFMEQMKTFIWSSNIDPDEFERGWKSVLKAFKLEGHKWLWEMYAIRSSWIPAFFRDKPMFGLLRSTSRSESENSFFSQFHRQSDSLCEFYIRFESAMDKQRHETARLNQEATSSIPSTITKLFLEADATQIYTRPIFYKVQAEILSSCYDIRIQSIGPLVDGIKTYEVQDVRLKDKLFEVNVSSQHAECSCKKFIMCGLPCSHAICALNHFMVNKIPRNLVLNRWSRMAENRPSSSKLFGVSDDFLKIDKVSLKTTNIWFNFQKSMNKAGADLEKLSHVEEVVKQLDCDLGDGEVMSKKAHLELLMGPQPTEDISIHVPNQCKNKGSGLKRFVSHREKAIKEGNKRARKCKLCGSTVHDARTCPSKKESSSKADVVLDGSDKE